VGTFGNGGSIRVVAPVVVIQDGGAISARSRGAGQAGSIAIAARSQLEMDEGAITTESEQSGGGQITLRVGRLIDLRDSSIESSVARLAGNAGDIMIDPDFLVLDNSFILARANAGRGGNIRISADQLVVSPDSGINAEAGAEGIDGNVEINAPEEDTTGALVILDAPLLDAASLLRQRCAARRDIGASSFTGVGRGGLPLSPDGPLLSAYASQARPAATVEAGEPAAAPGAVTLVMPCRGPA